MKASIGSGMKDGTFHGHANRFKSETGTSSRNLLYGKHGRCQKEGCTGRAYADKEYCYNHSGVCADCGNPCYPKSARCAGWGATAGHLKRLKDKGKEVNPFEAANVAKEYPKGYKAEIKWLIKQYERSRANGYLTELCIRRITALQEQLASW